MFEPTHGSAPKYAGYAVSIVNPIAMIASACMMLDYLHEKATGDKIRRAIVEVILEGKVRTYDMMKLKGSPDALQQGAASTKEMGDAIIKKIKSKE